MMKGSTLRMHFVILSTKISGLRGSGLSLEMDQGFAVD